MGRMIAVISAVIFVLCGGVFLAAYWHLQSTETAALDAKLAQIEQTATANRAAFAALAVNDVNVEVIDFIMNGERQIGQKALRVTPSLGVMEEGPTDLKSGLIRFAVPDTFQDQIERDQQEIERIMRQFPSK